MQKLRHDAKQILNYMAANGLVANAKKTVFMLLNLTKSEMEAEYTKEIKIGDCNVPRSDSTKLLGIEIDDQQNWNMHFHDLTTSLQHRTFTIRRISNQVPQKQLIKVVQSIWMSKLRYGLNLCNRVRISADDPTNKFMKEVQICQNKMLRMLDRVSLKEHVTVV